MTTTAASNRSDREISITRLIAAPRDLVWQVWTDPAEITHWWGPYGFTTTTHSRELRAGGIWRFTMHAPDGVDFQNRVEFDEVVPGERLAYRHSGEGATADIRFTSLVTFDDQPGGTLVTLRLTCETAEARDRLVKRSGAVEGGRQTLARFAERVAVKQTSGKPVPLLGVIPHLCVSPAAEAIDFYRRAFGFELTMRLDMPGSNQVMHAQMRFHGLPIMLVDEMPMPGSPRSPHSLGGTCMTIHLQVPDVDAAYAQAVQAGARANMPPTDMFWGDRYAHVIDPFGHHWSLATTNERLTPEQMQERAIEAFKNWAPGEGCGASEGA